MPAIAGREPNSREQNAESLSPSTSNYHPPGSKPSIRSSAFLGESRFMNKKEMKQTWPPNSPFHAIFLSIYVAFTQPNLQSNLLLCYLRFG